MKKIILGGVMTLSMLSILASPAIASSVDLTYDTVIENMSDMVTQFNDDGSMTEYLSEEAQKANIQEQIEAQFNKVSGLRSPTWVNYTYKTIETKYPTVSGYAGGQPTGGTKFSSGGGFSWASSGGPSVSVSAGWGGVSVSANLGKASKTSVGYSVAAPNKTNYFKLHVSKKYKVQKVAVYACPYTQPNKPQFQYYTYPKTFYSQDLSAKKV